MVPEDSRNKCHNPADNWQVQLTFPLQCFVAGPPTPALFAGASLRANVGPLQGPPDLDLVVVCHRLTERFIKRMKA